jgi:hypothetical protein
VFKGASQNSQRRVGRSSKGEQVARARKLDMIFDGKASKAARGKLKNMEDGQAARAEKSKMRAALQRSAVDPTKGRKQAKKIAAKLAERMVTSWSRSRRSPG